MASIKPTGEDGGTLRRRFAGVQAYRDLAVRLDPRGKFSNEFLARMVYAP